jgi:hypothetical protein
MGARGASFSMIGVCVGQLVCVVVVLRLPSTRPRDAIQSSRADVGVHREALSEG